jgi:sugar phosphate isomerase/epimerase|tara:strand:- start:1490 stop:2305 length:816 start_codon:yes stop_codon:yes gene_type:complete
MTPIRSGLCSITFRALTTKEVLSVAVEAGLDGIEWGADVHVPAGELDVAADVADRCLDAGLACPSYGTYVVAGRTPGDEVARVVDTALALGVSNLRIWTPYGVRPDAPAVERAEILEGIAHATVMAAERGLATSLEYHPGTLTETAASTLDVLAAVDHPDLFTYWQPDPSLDDAVAVSELAHVVGRLSHLHVFAWGTGFEDRNRLADGASLWEPALSAVPVGGPWGATGRDRWAFLEYVVDDDPANLADDAATLQAWLDARGNQEEDADRV